MYHNYYYSIKPRVLLQWLYNDYLISFQIIIIKRMAPKDRVIGVTVVGVGGGIVTVLVVSAILWYFDVPSTGVVLGVVESVLGSVVAGGATFAGLQYFNSPDVGRTTIVSGVVGWATSGIAAFVKTNYWDDE